MSLRLPSLPPGPDEHGRFGPFGGQFVPETLMAALEELVETFTRSQRDPAFASELELFSRTFAGRPTPLYRAQRLSERVG